ncbi:hypothetical protein [Salininema proteolyticum]|uniref:Uncharacterized protein n=1 Tax=Salininema proteolyticum TaxID=1607685 RepID=A0ABV8U3H7_9ACTN
MTSGYVPPEAIDAGRIDHEGDQYDLRVDASTGNVFLLQAASDDRPDAERVPVIVANCSRPAWPTMTVYAEAEYIRSRTVPNWRRDLGDKLSIAVRPFL